MKAPREKRPDTEQVKSRRRPAVDTDTKFYNSGRWRSYTKRFRSTRLWCEIHMAYVLVNELGLEDILPWFSKLDNEIKLRFLRRKGYTGEIDDVWGTDHIIPIKAPFYGSKLNPLNHQAVAMSWHQKKRQMEKEEVVENYIGQQGKRIPVRMLPGLKRYSDEVSVTELVSRYYVGESGLQTGPRGGENLA